MSISDSSVNASFGWHSVNSEAKLEQKILADKIAKVASIAQKVACVALAILCIAAAVNLISLAISLSVGISAFVSSAAIYGGASLYSKYLTCQIAGIVINKASSTEVNTPIPAGQCEILPTEHCADTVEWRKQIVKSAEHNLIISGNYCGGDNFADLLKTIREQMVEKPSLKVIIISSPIFLQGKSKAIKNGAAALKKMQKDFPQNFSLVISPDIWHISPGIKKTTNHTKLFVADYGKYSILGGSGIKDNFAKTGLDHLTNEHYLQQRTSTDQALEPLASAPNTDDESCQTLEEIVIDIATEAEAATDVEAALATAVNDIVESNPISASTAAPAEGSSFLDFLIPGNFRDMDFVLAPDELTGKTLYQQGLLLALRWEQYNKMMRRQPVEQLNIDCLGAFSGSASEILPEDSLTVQLLKTPIPSREELTTHMAEFHNHRAKTDNVATRIFCSGPEHSESVFAKELLLKIQTAQERIVINHMYFHPTTEIRQALVDAANRGVKIKLITVGVYDNCPNSHYGFGPRNKYNYVMLARAIAEENRPNLEVYEFQQQKKGLHKKVCVIDDTVIAGSSNLGYKSLVTTSDHEINFFSESHNFAEETLKICQIDISHSKQVEDPLHIHVNEIFRAALHRISAPLFG